MIRQLRLNAIQTKPWILAISGMLAMASAIGIGRFVYTPILPMMVSELGLSAGQAGMIASSNYLGYMIGAIVAATSIIKGSPRAWLLGSLFVSALTTLAMSWTEHYFEFLTLRFFGGVASALVLVYATALVIDRLTQIGREGLVFTLFAGVGLGVVLTALLTGLAMYVESGWRGAWINGGVASVVVAFLVALLVPSHHEDTAPRYSGRVKNNRSFTNLLIAYGLFGFGYVITATFLVQLVRTENYSSETEIAIWVLVGLCGAPSMWLWNHYASIVGNSKAFSLACALLAVGVAASVLLPGLWGLIPGAILFGSTFLAIGGLGLVESRDRSIQNPRHVFAIMTAVFGLGQIIGPTVGGYMSDTFGGFLLPSLLASGLLLLGAWLGVKEQKQQPPVT